MGENRLLLRLVAFACACGTVLTGWMLFVLFQAKPKAMPGRRPPALEAPAQRAPATRGPETGSNDVAAGGPARADAAGATSERSGSLPRSDLNVQLISTVIGGSRDESSALIVEPDQEPAVRRPGDLIAGGLARIAEIGEQGVVVDHGGRLELLQVGDAGREGSSSEAGHASESLEELEGYLSGPPEKRLAVDPGQAQAELRAMGEFSSDPARGGLQVDGLKPRSRLAELGLQSGDRIVSVDGAEIASLQEGMKALAETLYAEGESTLLTVVRPDGTRIEIATDSGKLLYRGPATQTP